MGADTKTEGGDFAALDRRLKALEDAHIKTLIPDGLDVKLVTFVSNPTTDTEDGVDHDLARVPVGYIVVSLDKAASIYKTTRPWTSSKMYLKTTNTKVSITLLVF